MRKLLVLALLIVPIMARADNFVADFSCTQSIGTDGFTPRHCEGTSASVPMHFDGTTYVGATHWDGFSWAFYLPEDWSTGVFRWGEFTDQLAFGVDFLTFLIYDSTAPCCASPYYIQINRPCPTGRPCLLPDAGQNFGYVSFHPSVNVHSTLVTTPEPATLTLLLAGLLFLAWRRPRATVGS